MKAGNINSILFSQFEVSEHIEFNGRHYVTFCTSSFLSHRFDHRSRVYVSSWHTDRDMDPNRMGFCFEDCDGKLDNLEIWQKG